MARPTDKQNGSDGPLLQQAIPLLIDWYSRHKKSMPWREDPTPYHVWISEIMLQQTRIEAAIPYYLRFIRELPDIPALAAVEEERLLKLWEGLGYYSRARNLKKAALLLTERYGGALPRTPEELQKLPGIGAYTAGAIASIAFGERTPAVDGNVMRVYARLCAMEEDVMKENTRRAVTASLAEVYPAGREAGLLTEALMELGEVVCIPNGAPLCDRCPVAEICRARRAGKQEELPLRSPPKARRIEERTILLLEQDGAYAVRRRPDHGLLAGLWEFPALEGYAREEEIFDYAVKQGCCPEALKAGPEALHVFTHVEWHMKGTFLTCRSRSPLFEWKTPLQILADCPMPKAFHVYLNAIKKR